MTRDDLLEDPVDNARLCAALAPTHCSACGHWHTASIMRRANIGTAEKLLDGDEFKSAIALALERPVAATALPHVVIVGATDTGLLASLCMAAFKTGGEDLVRALRITLVDLCETPLALCRRYATRLGLRFETVQADFLSFVPQSEADLVLMHGVLRFFPLAERDAYMRHIAGWLGRDGMLICSTHLGDRSAEGHRTAARDKALANLDDLAARALLPQDVPLAFLRQAVVEGVATGNGMPTTFANGDEAIAYYTSVGLPPLSLWITSTGGRSPLSAERQYRFRGIALCQRLLPTARTHVVDQGAIESDPTAAS